MREGHGVDEKAACMVGHEPDGTGVVSFSSFIFI